MLAGGRSCGSDVGQQVSIYTSPALGETLSPFDGSLTDYIISYVLVSPFARQQQHQSQGPGTGKPAHVAHNLLVLSSGSTIIGPSTGRQQAKIRNAMEEKEKRLLFVPVTCRSVSSSPLAADHFAGYMRVKAKKGTKRPKKTHLVTR